MKVKVNLENGETLEQAEEKLEKALKAKRECAHGEQYCDPAMNEFHDHIEARHKKVLERINQQIADEIKREVYSKGHI